MMGLTGGRIGSVPLALALALGLLGAAPGWGFERELAARAAELARSLEAKEVRSVAVIDFTDLQGRETELGRFLAEGLSAKLANAKSRVRVVDRSRLAKIMEEWKLSATGLVSPIDPETAEVARKVARIAGVQALVTGRLTPFRDTVRLSLLVLEVGSAEIVGAIDAQVPRTEAIADLESRSLTAECDPRSPPMEITIDGPPSQEREVDDYSLALYGCKRIGQAVQCSLVVRNRGHDRNLYLFLSDQTRAVFGEGGQVLASRVNLGRNWATGELSRVGLRMTEGAQATLGVVFEGVPEEVETFRFLDLDFYGFEERFPDVPVDR